MFNANLRSVLSQVNNITNSVILRYPETIAVSEDRSMMVRFNVSELDSDEFPEIPLNDTLGDFLRLFKLFGDERDISFSGNVVNVSDKEHSVKYITYNKDLMTPFDVDGKQFEVTKGVPTVAEFTLSTEDIKALKDAASIFKNLESVIIESKDGKLTLSLGNTNSFNAQSNTYTISKEYTELTKDFKVSLSMDKFSRLPMSSYTMQLKYNSDRDKYRLYAVNNSLTDMKLLVSCAV